VSYKDENTQHYEMNYKKTALKYYKEGFFFDLILMIPFGFLMFVNKFFKILWAIKTLKITKLFEFIDPNKINHFIRSLQERKVKGILSSDNIKYDTS